MPKPDLTPQQYKALKNIADGKPSYAGLRGSSQHGGHQQVVFALDRKGFIDYEQGKPFVTDDGKGALAAYR